MSGFLRRLRGRKPKEEESAEEPAEGPAEPTQGDTDIYPHRAPASDADPDTVPTEPSTEEAGGEVFGPPAPVADEIGPPASDARSSEVAAAPSAMYPPNAEVAAAESETPASTSPRLPEADHDASRSGHRPLAASTRCFLCGTEMTGSYCPVCRMTWNE